MAAQEPASARRDLTSWWRTFSKRAAKKEEERENTIVPGIFGVPLIQSIPYANVAISLFNEHGESYIYGYVPIVVAKCGVFLKEKATDVEGIFRLAGSEKRIKELKTAFDTPPRYGKGLDWTGYTVHDAANILRRYFNHLPEPIIPLGAYDNFRQPLRNHQAEAVGPIEGQAPSIGGFDPDDAVRNYQHTIKSLPSLNRQLLLYILDLLAVFAAKSDINKMTTSNLAAIFQPGILSHPQHDMSPQDYRLNQDVLIFLIDNQDHFLIGMEGTAVDEGTVKHVESGPPTPQGRSPTTTRNTTGIDRSASTASSAGADSLRKFGGIRRNVSTSSKRSRHSGAVPSPVNAAFGTPTGSGVHRSNTLPSKRSPALGSPRYPREKQSGHTTPSSEEPRAMLSPTSIETAVANIPQDKLSVKTPTTPRAAATMPIASQPDAKTASADDEPKRTQTMPPNKIELPPPAFQPTTQLKSVDTPALASIPGAFPLASPGVIPPSASTTPAASNQGTHELVPPSVLIPGGGRSPLLSPIRDRSDVAEATIDSGPPIEPTPVRSFTQMLGKAEEKNSKETRKPNKLQKKRLVMGVNQSAHSSTHSLTGSGNAALDTNHGHTAPVSPLYPPQPAYAQGHSQASGSREALQSFTTEAGSSRNSGTTLKPTMSPSASFRSHSTATEYSEAELNEEPTLEEKRSFWKSHKRGESKATPTSSQADLHGSVPGGDKSMSSFGSSGRGGGRRSLQNERQQSPEASMVFGSPPDERSNEKKGTFDWFHKMRQDHRERSDRRERAKSPQGSMSNMPLPHNLLRPRDSFPTRDRSTDAARVPDTRQADLSRPTEAPRPNDVPRPADVRPNDAPRSNDASLHNVVPASKTGQSSDTTLTGGPVNAPESKLEATAQSSSPVATSPTATSPTEALRITTSPTAQAPAVQSAKAEAAPQTPIQEPKSPAEKLSVEPTMAKSTDQAPVSPVEQPLPESTPGSPSLAITQHPSAPSPAIAQILASPVAPRGAKSPVRAPGAPSPSRASG